MGDGVQGELVFETIRAALRKRLVLAIVVGGIVFSTVYGFAATLTVSTTNLSAGNAAVASCTASVSASYSVAYDSTLPGYRVSQVTVSGITGCTSRTIVVDLTDTNNNSLFETTPYTITSSDVTAGHVNLTVTGHINAATVTGVSVAVTG